MFPSDQKIYDRLLQKSTQRKLTAEENDKLKELSELRLKAIKKKTSYNYEWDIEALKQK